MAMTFLTRRSALAGALAIGAAAMAGTMPASAQESWDDVLTKARAEGKVNFYTITPPDQVERLVKAFNEKEPKITINVVRGAADLIAKIESERQMGADGADAFLFGDALWFKRNADNVLEIGGPASPKWPQQYWVVPGKAGMVSLPPLGVLVWNKELVKEPLKDFKDVLKPDFANHIGTRRDMTAAYIGYLDFLEKNFGAEYLVKLAAQKPKFYSSVVPLTQAVAAGEVWIANISVPSIVLDLVAQGAPIDYAVPQPAFVTPHIAGALKQSKRPNAARVFADFLHSQDGQQALNGHKAAGSALTITDGVDVTGANVWDAEKYPQSVRDEWSKKFDALFGK